MHHLAFPGLPLLACIAALLPPAASPAILYPIGILFAATSLYLIAYAIRHSLP